jgi:phosphatidyl-myo-inositol dimannoside synthase
MAAPILLFTQEFPPYAGGVATYCDRLARHLTEEEQQVVVVAPSYTQQDAQLDKASPFTTIRYRNSRFFVFRHFYRFAALLRAIRRHRPSLVWAAEWHVGALVLPVSLARRLPMAITVYGSELLIAQQHFWKRPVARWVYQRAVAVFAISAYVIRLLDEFGIKSSRVHLVPLGVERGSSKDGYSPAAFDEQVAAIKRRHGLGDRSVLLTVARLTPRKGHDTVIEALAEVLKRRENVMYLIVGSGADRVRLEALAERLGVADNVIYAGQVPDEEKTAYYRSCDIFVMLSRRSDCLVEGFGLTFIEAALEAKPVIGTYHGGVPEAVLDRETGLLVPPSDPAAAAEAILMLLGDADLARRLGETGRQRATRDFTWRRTAKRSLGHLQPWLSR